ncbi:MAG: TraB/GumN family protein [Proteobacteria bacterium]|nr:TraB/GumN family protein [Pseudomonadota bacterium]
MNRLTASLLAALALTSAPPAAAATQHHPKPQPKALKAAPEQVRPALWVVKARGGGTVYLFGTVHALPKGVAWYDGKIAGAFESSDALVTEIIEKSPEEMRPVVAAKAALPEGQNLRDLLSPAQRKAFEAAMAANSLPAAAFDRYQPWYAAVALTTIPLLRGGFDPANGVDATLSAKADAAKRGHEALETAEYQLGLFAALPLAVQKRYLMEVVKNLPGVKDELAGIIRAWKAGNATRLARLMNADEDDPKLREVLLINRNRAWARWIRARLAKPGVTFVAVGAGHLAGPGSVQDQLKKLGLSATRVQ